MLNHRVVAKHNTFIINMMNDETSSGVQTKKEKRKTLQISRIKMINKYDVYDDMIFHGNRECVRSISWANEQLNTCTNICQFTDILATASCCPTVFCLHIIQNIVFFLFAVDVVIVDLFVYYE